jgi:hypothetical protein
LEFSPRQRRLAICAMNEAEDRTTSYYCIPPHRRDELRYDLLTGRDHEWEPLPETVLARVRHLQRQGVRKPLGYDFYRIELNDASILCAAERENLLPSLYPFLVYILTHEMIHLVRLSTRLMDMQDRFTVAESEEHRVQQISTRILGGSSKFQPILKTFCENGAVYCGRALISSSNSGVDGSRRPATSRV